MPRVSHLPRTGLLATVLLALPLPIGLGAASQDTPAPTRASVLRGEYGRYRANNDLLFYHLDIRVDPEKKVIGGKNTIRFKMLQDDARIQLDLYANLAIDRILLGATPLRYERELNTVWVDFPETLKAGREYSIDFHYSGTPAETGRFGGFTFRRTRPAGTGSRRPARGQEQASGGPTRISGATKSSRWRSASRFPTDWSTCPTASCCGKIDLGDGYTRWDWHVQYPINNYNVSLNIGKYEHFADRLDDLPIDFYALPENLERAKRQFAQAKPMLAVYKNYFGDYPFEKDGYKLIEVPYSGMEHQSAVTYGNRFANGYLERDWTGVGISLNSTSSSFTRARTSGSATACRAADVSDMWIQEGWTTYLEVVYVEYMFGNADALKYLNGYKPKVTNRQPIVAQRGINRQPAASDQYFKGALFINTLRSVVDDDQKWWELLRDFYQHFKYQTIMTEDVVRLLQREDTART